MRRPYTHLLYTFILGGYMVTYILYLYLYNIIIFCHGVCRKKVKCNLTLCWCCLYYCLRSHTTYFYSDIVTFRILKILLLSFMRRYKPAAHVRYIDNKSVSCLYPSRYSITRYTISLQSFITISFVYDLKTLWELRKKIIIVFVF